MGTLYVDSNASGLNDGTSWTDAWADLQTAWAAWVSGDICWVASDHSQTQATEEKFVADVMSAIDPFIMYSVSSTDDSYTPATAAQIATTGTNIDIWFDDSVIMYGIFFQTEQGNFKFGTTTYQYMEDCNVKWTTIDNTTKSLLSTYGLKAVKCTFDNTSAATGRIEIDTNLGGQFFDCIFTGRADAAGLVKANSVGMGSANYCGLYSGCDFSGVTDTVWLNDPVTSTCFVDCVFASGDSVRPPTGDLSRIVANYASAIDGAGSAKNYIAEIEMVAGGTIQDTVIFRDDGWLDEDGSTRLSHKMVSNTLLVGPHTPFYGPDLRAYVGSTGSKTFTVYGVEDFTTGPNEDECWIEVFYLGTTNSVKYSMAGGRSVFSTTGLTSDTKAWTGASGKTKFKIAETVTINKTGTYLVRVFLAQFESAKALWYCPLVEVS